MSSPNTVTLSKTKSIMERIESVILKLDSVVDSRNKKLQEIGATEKRIDEEFNRGKRSIDEQMSKGLTAMDNALTEKARAIDKQIEAVERNYLGDKISVEALVAHCLTLIIYRNGNPKEYIDADYKIYLFDSTDNTKEKRFAELMAIKEKYVQMISSDGDAVLIIKHLLKDEYMTKYKIIEALKTKCNKLADEYFEAIPKSDVYRAGNEIRALKHRRNLGSITENECLEGAFEAEHKRDTSSSEGIRYSIAFRLPTILNPIIESVDKTITEQKSKKYTFRD